ncbi:unnamed protein product [Owenia fusiformis]|uniref:Uncharacterized protein n=1 Tax=Owenia fusiformis TaxID=6347 RepID=A0A8J1TTP3_OWEFU|nr:unnamed protein product [Owenia fusiformis]
MGKKQSQQKKAKQSVFKVKEAKVNKDKSKHLKKKIDVKKVILQTRSRTVEVDSRFSQLKSNQPVKLKQNKQTLKHEKMTSTPSHKQPQMDINKTIDNLDFSKL